MKAWLQIALLLLQVANSIVTWLRSKQQIDAGYDKAVAESAIAILKKTETGKKIMERIDAMPDGDLDRLADDLGRQG